MWQQRVQDTIPVRLEPDQWVERYGDFLFRYAFFRLRSRELSQDLVQETFVGALKNADRFNGASSERTWLVGILRRKIIDHLRASYRNVSASESREAIVEDPSALFDQREFRRILADCLQEMPPRLAYVFVLRELEQLDSSEICRLMGITTSNLWVMLHRARTQLRHNLESKWFGRKPLVAYAQAVQS